ncbi:ABC transporter substrate-binding protein [Pseudomonas sp. NPDC007930]|uniref:ABC transporter substrate-binding protein n=1 Tax=Pseudomonas sp. NPDC007930 TaxID=3364417 RepID=UPI0036E5D5B2
MREAAGGLRRRRLLHGGLALAAAGLCPRWAKAAPPQRLITLFQGATDTAVALGIRPCAVVDSWSEKPTYRYLRAALAGVPHVGLETQPSLEAIALLQPDLIVASRFRHERVAGVFNQLCPTLMLEEVFEFRQTLALMGQATGRQGQASAVQAAWDARVAGLAGRLRARFGQQWPLSVAVLDLRQDHLRAYLPGSFAGAVLRQLGFTWNAYSQQAKGVSLKISNRESLPVVNADVFFVFGHGDGPALQRQYASLSQHPIWQRLDAPRHGQVWPVDGVAWVLAGGILGAQRMLDDIERSLLGEAPA